MKIVLLVVYFAVLVGIGLYCRKHATDVNGFVLGGRNVGPWLTAFAYGTSYFSAVVFVGYAGQFGWKYGIAATWAGIGNAIIGSLMAWVILGRRTRIMTQHLDSATMPQYFGMRFDSKPLKICASAIIFIFLIPYTASLYNGLSRLFGMAFNIDYSVCIILMAVLTAIYVIAGGYMATAINDFIQGIIMLFGIVTIIVAVLNSKGGLMEAMNGLAQITDETVSTTPGIFNSFLGPDPLNLMFVVILTSLGTWGLPQMVGKFYAIKSEKDIHKGTVISTVFAIIVAGGCYFLGGFGRLYADKVQSTPDGKLMMDTVVPSMLSTLPAIIIAVVIVLVLSASMSTLSSLVLTSSSTFTLDVIKTGKKDMTEKQQIFIMRLFIVFFIVVSAVIAIVKDSFPGITFIAQMMGVSWGALAGAFLAPFLYGLYWKKVTKSATAVCFVWGSTVAILQLVVSLAKIDMSWGGPVIKFLFSSSINSGVLAMVGGLVIVPIVSLLTKKPDEKEVNELFSCYEEKAQVAVKEHLNN